MKKFICILTLTAALLAGCSSGGAGSSNTQTGAVNGQTQAQEQANGAVNQDAAANREKQRERSDDPANSAIGFISSLTYFSSVDDFLNSPLAEHLEKSGYKPMSLTFDETKYQVLNVFADSNFYSYTLMDTVTEQSITYTFIFGSSREKLEDLSVTDNDTIELAENGSGSLSVMAVRSANDANSVQYLTYMPKDGVEARLSINGASIEQLTAAFKDITPVE